MNTASTPAVTYAYADGSANTVRPTSVTYPKGRVVTTSYGAAGGDDDRLSRTGSYVDPGSVTLAAYTYLGLGSVVKVDYPTPQVRYDLATGSGSNPYENTDISHVIYRYEYRFHTRCDLRVRRWLGQFRPYRPSHSRS